MQILAMLYAGADGLDGLRAFERQAIPILREHGGTLVRAFEPEAAGTGDTPHEIHLLEFPSSEAFAAYRSDPRLAALSELRERGISRTVVYVSARDVEY